jgi:hypothetical protein
MAITTSGVFFLTMEKFLTGAAATDPESWEADDNLITLISDSATPNFDTMDFWDDLTAQEVTGSGWTDTALTGTELTISSGVMTFDATDISVGSTTLSNAMASVLRLNIGTDGTDCLVMLHDFVTAVSTSSGTFGIQWHSSGLLTADLVPN